MKPRYFATGIIVVLTFITILNSILGNIIASIVQKSLGVNARLVIFPFALSSVILIGYEVRGQLKKVVSATETTFRGNIDINKIRTRLINKIEFTWIKGFLEPSLSKFGQIELDLDYRSGIVEDPLETIVQRPDGFANKTYSLNQILNIFREFEDSMLILGAPGAGKTTTLLELAKVLLMRAREDAGIPIPFIFNLASWSSQRRLLEEWLVEELISKYSIPSELAHAWIKQGNVQLLLDGLDEVQPGYREACVEAINQYHKNNPLVPMAICCRSSVYETLGKRLQLLGSVFIRPLTAEQTSKYLNNKSLLGIKTLLKSDSQFKEMLDNPLMLNITASIYANTKGLHSVQSTTNVDERRMEIFKTYIQVMFERRTKKLVYDKSRTLRYLAWLAQTMKKNSQSTFLLDQLQPEWLRTKKLRIIYFLCDRFLWPVLFGLTIGLVCFSIAALCERLGVATSVCLKGQIGVICFGLIREIIIFTAVISMILGVFFGGFRPYQIPGKTRLINSVIGFFIGGIAGYLAPTGSPFVYAQTGALFGLVAPFLAGGPSLDSRHVQIVEKVNWSPLKALVFLAVCLVGSPLFWLIYNWFILDISLSQVPTILLEGVAFGLGYGMIIGVLGGVVTKDIEDGILPNQGIWRSISTSAILALGVLITSAVAGIILGFLAQINPGHLLNDVTIWLGNRQANGILAGLIAGLGEAPPFMAFTFLIYGGYAFMSHFTLRLILWLSGCIPPNYIRFLNQCVDRVFLRRVGGGYTFVHRLLMDSFANLRADK